MFRKILLELFLPFSPFKKDSKHPMDYDFCTDLTKIKTGAAAKHLLKQTDECTALQSQID